MSNLSLSISEALDLASLAAAHAEREEADAAGRMHNAAISRIESAKRFRALAERLRDFAAAEQELANETASAGVRKWRKARGDL